MPKTKIKTGYPWGLSIVLLVWFFFLALGVALVTPRKETVPCLSCAPDPELVEEMRNPTIIVPKQESVEDIIRRVAHEEAMTSEETERFVQIAWCESRFKPDAVSRTNDHGLFQLHSPTWKFDRDKVYEAEYNTRYAMQVVYPAQGFGAWVCSANN